MASSHFSRKSSALWLRPRRIDFQPDGHGPGTFSFSPAAGRSSGLADVDSSIVAEESSMSDAPGSDPRAMIVRRQAHSA